MTHIKPEVNAKSKHKTSFHKRPLAEERESSPLGPRLHLARRKSGLSLRSLGELVGSSHETIRLMENGFKFPDEATMEALCQALGVTREYLTEPHDISLGEVEFRKKARTSAADRDAIRGELLELLERYLEVEDILEIDEQWSPPPLKASSPNDTQDYAEEMALALREHWKLGFEPIHNLTTVLEDHGLKVLVPKASVSISGMTCEVHRADRPSVFAIVANHDHPLERRRFTIAHELAHRLLNFEGLNGKMAESMCNKFAGAFLVPAETLRRHMGAHPHTPIYREIMIAKKFFRVSAAMLTMRLEQVGIIELWQRDNILQSFGRTWRSIEPEPLEIAAASKLEMPRFERLVYQALGCGFITVEKAADLLRPNVSYAEVKRALQGPPMD